MIIQHNIPLNDKNWFKTGGAARYYCQPTNPDDFKQALTYAHKNNLDIFVLGQGANILISDHGFDGLVIHPHIKNITATELDDTNVAATAGAGVTMHDLIVWCLDHNILGLEEFSGIPGTVGGSVYINLHYYDFLLEQFLISAQIMHKDSGIVEPVTPEWFNFGYDHSKLFEKNHYLISATFKLKKASALETAYARGRRTEIIRHREKRYPSKNTCGSFFRNFHDNEVTMTSNGKKMIYVAYYLDNLGIKGTLHVGDALVSHQHANMLVNRGNASSTDIINLVRTMQKMVHERFGIIPQPECQLIGFKHWPLL